MDAVYPSELSDAEWQVVERLLPAPKPRGRKLEIGWRRILDGIFYVNKEGCQWRALPKEFGKWQSFYHYFRLWRIDGTWQRVNDALRRLERKAQGRKAEPSVGIMDSQSAKTTAKKGPRGYDAGKKICGRKRHLMVDTQGLVLTALVHPADIQDRDGAKLLIEQMKCTLPRLRTVFADGGYAGQLVDWFWDSVRWNLEIVKRTATAGFQLLPKRWIVERTFAWLSQYRRHSRDYEELPETSEAMIYVSMIRLMLRRAGKRKANA
ncbi:IS5 family transposase [Anatilimnocola aggregata]|nr:IS5 family transposase [Anatilimnocola aggregata]